MELQDSIRLILGQEDHGLARRFYDLLFERHPELRERFTETDMSRQRIMFTVALQTVTQQYLLPNKGLEAYMRYLGSLHRQRGIHAEDFPKFANVLLEALAEFHGDDWPELDDDWSAALGESVRLMGLGAVEGLDGDDGRTASAGGAA